MSKLGTYRNKNVYDYGSLTTAISASIDNDIFSVYWITGGWGKMFWKGEEIAHVQSDKDNLHVVNFDEEIWSPKKKEAPSYVKEVSVTSGETEEKEAPLYDVNWYSKIMGELEEQWNRMRPTFGVGADG